MQRGTFMMDSGKMINITEMGRKYGLMATYMNVNTKKVKDLDLANLCCLMEINMKVNFLTITCTAKALINGLMVELIQEIGLKMRCKDMESKFGQMDANMMDPGWMANRMDKALTQMKTGRQEWEHGKKAKGFYGKID